jgi:glycosyltransferase involved in cell wall biosynthesis
MKLLIFTQKIDTKDSVLGFFHNWVIEFSKKFEKVTVICLQKGEYSLPDNVKVLSLGKEEGLGRMVYIKRFYSYIYRERKNYDSVFVHMNQVYIILGGLLWKLWGKKMGLWYAHGSISRSLRVAEKMTDLVFTSTQSGFRLPSKKINIMGQGIDPHLFKPLGDNVYSKENFFNIISVGRISPIKDYDTFIDAISLVHNNDKNVSVSVIGGAGTEEQEHYLETLKIKVLDKGLGEVVNFLGPVQNDKIITHLQKSNLYINASHTGSLDKAILEAMSVEVPILTCNEALLGILGPYENKLMFPKGNPSILSDKIMNIISMTNNESQKMRSDLREIVVKKHSIQGLIKKIKDVYEQ